MLVLSGAFIGLLYSILLTLTGPHLLHFLPRFTIIHCLYYSATMAILFYFFRDETVKTPLFSFENLWSIKWLPNLILSIHFLFWLITSSFLIPLGFNLKLLFGIAGSVVLFLFFFLLTKMISGNLFSRRTILILLVLVFAIRLTVVMSVPTPFITGWMIIPDSKSLIYKTFFPFSINMTEAIKSYTVLMPDIPDGEKVAVLVLDAFREDFVGKTLSGIEVTPNISRLAEKHVYFPNYRVQTSATKSSVASFFTGKYLREHGVFRFMETDRNFSKDVQEKMKWEEDKVLGHALSDRFQTLAERLEQTGYTNAGMVKIGHIFNRFNYDQGFDFYSTPRNYNSSFKNLSELNIIIFWLLKEQPEKTFLYFHLTGPHYPYPMGKRNIQFWERTPYYEEGTVSPPEWDVEDVSELLQSKASPEKFNKMKAEIKYLKHLYGADVNYFDLFVLPQYINAFKKLGIYQDLLFSITSDHGENLYDHDRFYGHVKHLYEETINVPLIMKLPRSLRQNHSSIESPDSLNVESIDLTASILDFANAPTDDLSGTTFLPYLLEKKNKEEFEVSISETSRQNLIDQFAVVKGDWKLIHNYNKESNELYNLKQDPREQNPLNNPKKKRELMSVIEEKFGEGRDFVHGTSWLKGLNEREWKNLENLGYF